MKRKVARIGPSTLMISLPSFWVKNNNIKKGDEINIDIIGNEIKVSSNNSINQGKISLDINNLDDRVLRWLLSILHKTGYDEIELLYNKKSAINITQELVKDLMMGFIIADQNEKKIIIKSISTEIEKEFDTILRKSFLTTLSMGQNTLEAVKEENYSTIKDLIGIEKANNQFTNFCQRIINKRGYKEFKKNSLIYTIIWNIEKICDEYKYICNFIQENNSLKFNKNIITFFSNANNFFKQFYELFYKFNVKELNELIKEKNELLEEYITLIKKSKWNENYVLNHLKEIITKTSDLAPSIIGLNLT